MDTPSDAAIERFWRRAERTDDATLYRNLRAGVYGTPGSTRRAVAERALDLRFAERARVLQIATREEGAELLGGAERASRVARMARWISFVALALALLGFARGFGLI